MAFVLAAGAAIASMTPGAAAQWNVIGAVAFVLSCAASSCALLAVFLRFARKANAVGDSLRDNAYGIFLVHYAFVAWLQYALLSADVGGLAKGAIVTVGALALSWAVSAALRTIPIVRRVV